MSSVQVAIRVRPQKGNLCTTVLEDPPKVTLRDKVFTFNYTYGVHSTQERIYEECIRSFIDGSFDGYNATVLAYGQTGSGKTYTMGTGLDASTPQEEFGIIPRAVDHLFTSIEARRKEATQNELMPDFEIQIQFIELYNEQIRDLLDTTRDPKSKKIKIHENAAGEILTSGLITRPVSSFDDVMKSLREGTKARSTGATRMNTESSRSHAVFTILLKQRGMVKDVEKTSKISFVDLAGSESIKRTGATGQRAKEGISINAGLLTLGKVISALASKRPFIPYRESKLTRLLKDSLGGNSRTLMMACVSPCDNNFIETLNTLKFANRAKRVTSRVTPQDKGSSPMERLRQEMELLKEENRSLKDTLKRLSDDGAVANLVQEIDDLRTKLANTEAALNQVRSSSPLQRSFSSAFPGSPDDSIIPVLEAVETRKSRNEISSVEEEEEEEEEEQQQQQQQEEEEEQDDNDSDEDESSSDGSDSEDKAQGSSFQKSRKVAEQKWNSFYKCLQALIKTQSSLSILEITHQSLIKKRETEDQGQIGEEILECEADILRIGEIWEDPKQEEITGILSRLSHDEALLFVEKLLQVSINKGISEAVSKVQIDNLEEFGLDSNPSTYQAESVSHESASCSEDEDEHRKPVQQSSDIYCDEERSPSHLIQ